MCNNLLLLFKCSAYFFTFKTLLLIGISQFIIVSESTSSSDSSSDQEIVKLFFCLFRNVGHSDLM
ncbi:hypothetical protein A2U01_0048006 [Trifolium medium]|uniref:Uncharacterized protein n=1 Tax=Trifolium medium TaxID=97028 RepID=A0A392QS49_9FABA|nr:hypothetical protein [Trifolium medium]